MKKCSVLTFLIFSSFALCFAGLFSAWFGFMSLGFVFGFLACPFSFFSILISYSIVSEEA